MRSESNRDFLEFHDLRSDTILSIVGRAQVLAGAWNERAMPQSLAGKRVGIVVDDGGWRNTSAFDLGVQAMGGISVQLPIRFNVHETTADLAGYLDNWFDILAVRTQELSTLRGLAERPSSTPGRDQIIPARRLAISLISEAGAERSRA